MSAGAPFPGSPSGVDTAGRQPSTPEMASGTGPTGAAELAPRVRPFTLEQEAFLREIVREEVAEVTRRRSRLER